MTNYLLCSDCHNVILKSSKTGGFKVCAKVILVQNDKAFAVCKGCSAEIPVPLVYDESIAKSLGKEPKLYLKR